MIPFHSVLLLLSAASNPLLIDGKEIYNRNEIADMNTHDEGILSNNKNVNRSSALSYMASTIPSQNLEAYMSTVSTFI